MRTSIRTTSGRCACTPLTAPAPSPGLADDAQVVGGRQDGLQTRADERVVVSEEHSERLHLHGVRPPSGAWR
jgi:hypothetical protein